MLAIVDSTKTSGRADAQIAFGQMCGASDEWTAGRQDDRQTGGLADERTGQRRDDWTGQREDMRTSD